MLRYEVKKVIDNDPKALNLEPWKVIDTGPDGMNAVHTVIRDCMTRDEARSFASKKNKKWRKENEKGKKKEKREVV